jgi:hypothetical protein
MTINPPIYLPFHIAEDTGKSAVPFNSAVIDTAQSNLEVAKVKT